MNYKLRKATLNDLPTLLKFEQGVIKAERPFDSTIQEGEITYYDISELINSEESEVLVVDINDQIVASGYLGFMFVHENHRGLGLNKLIIDALLKWCQERNIFEIRLDTYQDNISAIKAYEKAGFKKHMINMRLNITDLDL